MVDTMIRILGKSGVENMAPEPFLDRVSQGPVLMDIGTGDGRYPLHFARENTQWFCLGIDPSAEGMQKNAMRSFRKPARGGAANVCFMVSRVEDLPPLLNGLAERVTVHFPWAGLLFGIVTGREPVLGNLAALLKTGGHLDLWLNMHTFDQGDLRQRYQLPMVDLNHVDTVMAIHFKKVGLTVVERRFLGDAPLPVRTTWGGRLVRGSGRESLFVRAVMEERTDYAAISPLPCVSGST